MAKADNDLATKALPFWALWGAPGAVLTLSVGFHVIDLGPYGLMYVTWGTFALVLLTFVPEKLYGKYRK